MQLGVGKPSRNLSFSLSTTDFCPEEKVKVIWKVKGHKGQGYRYYSGPCGLKEAGRVNWTAMIVDSALGSIHTCDVLDVNYSLDNGLYYTKWVLSHLLFGQLLLGLKSMYPFFTIVWTEKYTQ